MLIDWSETTIKKLVRDTKKRYYENLLMKDSCNSKTIWNVINNLTKLKEINNITLNFEGTVIDQPQQISECFNTFF